MADLTPARRRALAVLLNGEATGREVRVSNETTAINMLGGTVLPGGRTIWPQLRIYWSVADWLCAQGYTTRGMRLGADQLQLTVSGRRLAKEVACD